MSPSGKLDVTAVSSLHADFVAHSGKDIVLDLGAVTQFGALCLQTCLAAAQAAKRSETTFEIVNATDPVLAQIGAMGFTPETLAEGCT
ncbi:hypothetical protein Z946_3926 [Sulfitobacter noctilucicola]|uniref:Chemotaxis protein CheX n=1 Tax=Sulfitobacter noctilucicola TaxID=1342301 RepID=A0A7W6M7H2_9RHOB|nr:STAS domain-containing protein [Sulfitobacter noctilucicola]KIN65029.1 hypothetical protein Z946_3926 [Sulfitobacter noctilucicola]MBB4173831.1 chemotaxis protein CheX [Sulfitobacter noctilucicola]